MRPHPLAPATGPAVLPLSLIASGPALQPGPESTLHTLYRITVSAALGERAPVDVPAAAEVIGHARIEQAPIRDVRDRVRNDPGLSGALVSGRFVQGGFHIRGVEGRRLRAGLDVALAPAAFATGGSPEANRNFVDLGQPTRVERSWRSAPFNLRRRG